LIHHHFSLATLLSPHSPFAADFSAEVVPAISSQSTLNQLNSNTKSRMKRGKTQQQQQISKTAGEVDPPPSFPKLAGCRPSIRQQISSHPFILWAV
jgi:hypothetical protein